MTPIRSATPARPGPTDPGRGPLENVRGRVAFEGVRFSGDGRRPALEGVDFTAEPGAIRTVGVDVRDAALDSLRAEIGVVFQKSLPFDRGIAWNLRLGRPAATSALVAATEARVQAAQKTCGRITERGSFEELLAAKGFCAEIIRTQYQDSPEGRAPDGQPAAWPSDTL
jgi:ABC-type multidrug transport system fused ATPase/permease subunit